MYIYMNVYIHKCTYVHKYFGSYVCRTSTMSSASARSAAHARDSRQSVSKRASWYSCRACAYPRNRLPEGSGFREGDALSEFRVQGSEFRDHLKSREPRIWPRAGLCR